MLSERKQITLTLDPLSSERPLAYWNTNTNGWETANGDYQVNVGTSSRDIRLTGTFHIQPLDQK